MGMYTEHSARISIHKSEVKLIEWLKRWVAWTDGPTEIEPFEIHPFFETDRWRHLPHTQSAYFNIERNTDEWSKIVDDPWDLDKAILILSGSIKNYDSEIDKFCDWISRYTSDKVLGYSRYEENEQRDYHFNRNGDSK